MSRQQSFKIVRWAGVACILGYNILTSLKDVISGHVAQSISPFLLVFVTFGCSAIFFQLLAWKKDRVNYQKPLQNKSILWKVNLSTVGAWLGLFYGVKYLEPAIVSAIITGFGPAIATLFQGRRPEEKVLFVEKLAAVGILACTLVLVYISLNGSSSLKQYEFTGMIMGTIFSMLSSLSCVMTTYYTKQWSNIGCSPISIMAHRFYLLTPISLIAYLYTGGSLKPLIENSPYILYIIVFGVIAPLLLMQYGIKHSSPILVMILFSMGPAFTYLFQIGDPRLQLSFSSGFFIVLSCLISIWVTITTVSKKVN